jgi:hypothetical protein
MKKFSMFLISLLVSSLAFGQAVIYSSRTAQVSFYRTTVGTATALAIPGASVGGNVVSWKICNDAINTSTHLLVGEAVDVSTDGVMLGLGQCVECLSCKGDTLKLIKVEGQAAANGYTVIQYRE